MAAERRHGFDFPPILEGYKPERSVYGVDYKLQRTLELEDRVTDEEVTMRILDVVATREENLPPGSFETSSGPVTALNLGNMALILINTGPEQRILYTSVRRPNGSLDTITDIASNETQLGRPVTPEDRRLVIELLHEGFKNARITPKE